MKRAAVALLAITVWGLSATVDTPHRVLPVSAVATQFAAARAEQILSRLLADERPHPVSSVANAAVRARILQEFAALGIPARTYQAFVCQPERGFERIACATVNDLIAQVVPGSGGAVLMMAHYDSVPASPGASDNMSGVAAVLEAARALRASRGGPLHPVMALITEGEEAGLLGAYAFLSNPDLKAAVGAVVNVDARGTAGASLLFQTSAGDGPLIDLYARSVPAPVTSSLYAEIYRRLPNDTDLTPFIEAGYPAFNFAFIDNERYYHSVLDQQRNLSAASLQMQGDNLLGVVRALEQTPYSRLRGGDAIYLSLFNRVVPRVAARAALPLALVVWIALALAAWLEFRARHNAQGMTASSLLATVLMPPALILGCAAAGFALARIAQLVSGTADPSYAYPIALRLALSFGVWGVVLVMVRWTDTRTAAASGWLWMAGLGVLCAALAPGVSPYFIFPALVAAVVLLATALAPGGWMSRYGRVALLVAGLAALVVWTGLMRAGEAVMGLRLHPLFTVPAAFALLGVAPLLATAPLEARLDRRREPVARAVAASGLAAVVAAVTAGLLPAFSAASPERLNLIYFQTPEAARWIADSSFKGKSAMTLPQALLNAGHFRLAAPMSRLLGDGPWFMATAGVPQFASPRATITTVAVRPSMGDAAKLDKNSSGEDERTVLHTADIQLRGSQEADAMLLLVPASADVRSIDLRGQHLHPPRGPRDTRDIELLCLSRDCRDETVTLTWAGSPSELEFAEMRYGLPAFGAFLARARPATAMPSQSGDAVVLADRARLP